MTHAVSSTMTPDKPPSREEILRKANMADKEIEQVVHDHDLVTLQPDEIVLNATENDTGVDVVLGEGSFGQVFEVKHIQLSTTASDMAQRSSYSPHPHSSMRKKSSKLTSDVLLEVANEEDSTDAQDDIRGGVSRRNYSLDVRSPSSSSSYGYAMNHRTKSSLQMRSLLSVPTFESTCNDNDSNRRYVIKKCKSTDIDSASEISVFRAAAMDAIDMANEAIILATLDHPHIVKLYAISARSVLSSHFFIMLEHLPVMLVDKLREWKKNMTSSVSSSSSSGGIKMKMKKIFNKKEIEEKNLRDRISSTLVGLGKAFEYLHSRNIIYRDVKRQNIGFAENENVILFDFGLAKRISPSSSSSSNKNEAYKLSRVGSPRYMAPEVIARLPYNEKADVFSFGVLMWEICTLEQAHKGVDPREHFDLVVKRGAKLKPVSWWPSSVKNIIDRCLTRDFKDRPSFEWVNHELARFDQS